MITVVGLAWFNREQLIGIIVTYDPNNPGEPFKGRIGAVPELYTATTTHTINYLQQHAQRIDLKVASMAITAHGQWHPMPNALPGEESSWTAVETYLLTKDNNNKGDIDI